MYASSSFSSSFSSDRPRPVNYSVKLPTVSESPLSEEKTAPRRATSNIYFREASPMTPPSGVTTTPQSVHPVDGMIGSNLEQLLKGVSSSSGKKSKSYPGPADAPRSGSGSQVRTTDPHYSHQRSPSWTQYRDPTIPSKSARPVKHLHTVHPSFDPERSQQYWENLRNLKKQANHPDRSSSFSFNVNDETFNQSRRQSSGFSNSAENISTKFTPEDWDGKFAAGADYFKPEMKTRTQSTSRPRGRSPVKVRSADATKFGQARVDSPPPVESPGGTKFSAEEWNETFKPQTFMPPTITRTATTPSRKRTGPSIRPTMGTAAVVDDGETSHDKPLFTGRKNMRTMTSSPEPMDVDTPPANNTVPQYATTPNGHLKVSTEAPTRAASTSVSQSPTDTEGLKVNFDDLKIRDLMSTLALPTPPHPPMLDPVKYDRSTRAFFDEYLIRYEKYMAEWDVFNSKYLLHMVARRRQNDMFKERRWTEPQSTELYRLGLKEDQAVLKSWLEVTEVHESIVKMFVAYRERMLARELEGGGEREKMRARKKTH